MQFFQQAALGAFPGCRRVALQLRFKLSSGFMLRSHAAIDQQHALTPPGPAPSLWPCSTVPKEYNGIECNRIVFAETDY